MANEPVKTMMADLMASYEQGSKAIAPIFSVAALFLDANGAEETDKKQLRETLSRNGNLRKKDFDRMLTAITEPGNNRAKEIRLLLRDFLVHQQEMIEQLGGYFAQIRAGMESGDIEKIKPVFVRVKEIIAQQEQARQELASELAEQEKEQQKIQTGVKSLLQKGRELQVRDFKEMLAGIKRQSKDRSEQNSLRRETVSQMLAGYKTARQTARNIKGNPIPSVIPVKTGIHPDALRDRDLFRGNDISVDSRWSLPRAFPPRADPPVAETRGGNDTAEK